MLKVGITGGIGSGKTTVCNVFRNLGVPIFNSDLVARELLNTNEALKIQIKRTFDTDMYTAQGVLDRERMANLVFNNRAELEKINKLVHPLVKEEFEEFCYEKNGHSYVVKEAAILFESGAYKELDKVITVFCPKEKRIERIMARDNVTRDRVEKRMRFQYSDDERNNMADFILVNDDTEELLPQIMELHDFFLNQ